MDRAAPHRDIAAAMEEARRALSSGDLSTTERLCAEVLSFAPHDGRAWTLLTETALLRDRPDAAIVCADRAVTLLPNDPIAHIMRAKCLFFSGEIRLARDAAEAASHRIGTVPEAMDALG